LRFSKVILYHPGHYENDTNGALFSVFLLIALDIHENHQYRYYYLQIFDALALGQTHANSKK